MTQPDASKQELPPGAVSALNPQAGGLYQLTPEDEVIVNSYAKQRGITQIEAVRALLQHKRSNVDGQASQASAMERTMGVIEQAQALGVASNDPNDVINSMGKGLVIKNLAKGLNDGDSNNKKASSFEDLKDMMYLKIMGNLAGANDNTNNNNNNQGSSSIVQEMKSENDKLRQDLKDAEAKRMQEQKDAEAKRMQEQKDAEARRQADMEKLEAKMRDMLFEKKIEKLEEKAAAAQTSVIQELKSLGERVDMYGRIPQTVAPERKDAVSELEDIGGKLDRIKKALAPIFPQVAAPAAPSLSVPASLPPSLRNPDGSTDYLAAAERIGAIVVRGIEAANKKPPGNVAAEVAAQPASSPAQQTYTERKMGLDEYADYLLSLKVHNQEQKQWLINYQAHLEKEQAKMRVLVGTSAEQSVQQSTEQPAVHPYQPPAEQPVEPYTLDSIIGIGDEQTLDQDQPEQMDVGRGDIEQPSDAESQQDPSGQLENGEQLAEDVEEQSPEQPIEEDTDVVEKLQKAEAERIKRLQGVL
ncbi:MAG: hypothetical protein Q8S44_07585 [Flavobacteriaceae bacterium]|nr:hypothetical protein [Flavobacteriaceae bacterium]